MTEGRDRYNEHKAKKTKVNGEVEDSGLRPGGAHTLTGPCNPSGNVAASGLRPGGAHTSNGPCNPSGNEAASSNGSNRQGVKRNGLEVQPDTLPSEEHARKFQRQEDDAEGENQEEANEGVDIDMENQDFQTDKRDSDCMFVEHWKDRKPHICQVQGGEPEFWDDISGKPLDTEMVLKAREDEMGEPAKHEVY